MTITAAIKLLVERYATQHGFTAEEINEGSCWDFADELKNLFPGGEVLDNETILGIDQEWSHAFFLFEGRYYDSEAPHGVEDWRQLPCCKRCETST